MASRAWVAHLDSPTHFAVTSHLLLAHKMWPDCLAFFPSLGLHLNVEHSAPPIMSAQFFTESASMSLPTGGAPAQGGEPSATVMPPIHLGLLLEREHWSWPGLYTWSVPVISSNQLPDLAPLMVSLLQPRVTAYEPPG